MEFLGLGLGLGLIVVGAAFGIGKLGAAATESMARQPEVAGKISTAARDVTTHHGDERIGDRLRLK